MVDENTLKELNNIILDDKVINLRLFNNDYLIFDKLDYQTKTDLLNDCTLFLRDKLRRLYGINY